MADNLLSFKGHLYARIDKASEKVDFLPAAIKAAKAVSKLGSKNDEKVDNEPTEVVDSANEQVANAVFAISHAIEKAEKELKAVKPVDNAHKAEIRNALNKLQKMTTDVHTIAEMLTDFE